MKGELYPRYIETSAKYIQQPGFRPEMCGLWVSTEKLKKKKQNKRLFETQCNGAFPVFVKTEPLPANAKKKNTVKSYH